MTRDAKLYILRDKDWKPLKEIIEAHKRRYTIENDIAIIKRSTSNIHNYAILSVSEEVDKIVKSYGGELLTEKDTLRYSLKHESHWDELLFGYDNLRSFL